MERNERHRRGLSTLELVLALPLLLFIMALMLNYGAIASWKIRGSLVARHALWSTRWPRSGYTLPRPEYWPATASLGVSGAQDALVLDDPRAQHPVARGPLPAGATVNDQLLNPSRGFRTGDARLDRAYPLMASLGRYQLHAHAEVLEDKWQYQRLGLGSNVQRRIPAIYVLARAPVSLSQAYIRTAIAILQAPFRADLYPLDRDPEWRAYHLRFPLRIGAPPDFYPRLQGFCSLDYPLVEGHRENLIDRIRGKKERDSQGRITRQVPSVVERMTRAFIGLYQQVQRVLEEQIAALQNGGQAAPGQIAAMQAEIRQLQAKIDTLEQFLQTL